MSLIQTDYTKFVGKKLRIVAASYIGSRPGVAVAPLSDQNLKSFYRTRALYQSNISNMVISAPSPGSGPRSEKVLNPKQVELEAWSSRLNMGVREVEDVLPGEERCSGGAWARFSQREKGRPPAAIAHHHQHCDALSIVLF